MDALIDVLVSNLRCKDLSRGQFRHYTHQLALCLAHKTTNYLTTVPITVQTPLGQAAGKKFDHSIKLISILRSGLVLLPAFIEYFPDAHIGCIGLKRDEKTAIAHQYYQNLPDIINSEQIIVLDPMIATGGSATAALKIITELGVEQKRIIFVAIIGSQEGVDTVLKTFPHIKLIIAAVDQKLNPNKFIFPGLGDFGDRYFGTE